MISIEQIKKPVIEEFKLFDFQFKEALKSSNETLNDINKYISKNMGKQIRPLLTFLAAKICENSNLNTIRAAVSLELLHTASLIHDDIVDDTTERRGRKSVNAIWKNKIAVLVGDHLLSKSLSIANQTKDLCIIDNVTNLGKELTEGELLQIEIARNISIDEEKYFDVIHKKTATLFSSCTTLGAISANADEKKIEILRQFGNIYGICFQIRDDIFDYISSEKEIGKPVGNDIREGRITLPLIYALNNANGKIKEEYIKIIKEQHFAPQNIERLLTFAKENGGIEYAEKKIQDYIEKGIEIIQPFSDSETKNSLIMTLKHTIDRKK